MSLFTIKLLLENICCTDIYCDVYDALPYESNDYWDVTSFMDYEDIEGDCVRSLRKILIKGCL